MNECRIRVSNLSEENALNLLKVIRSQKTGGKLELDRPDPPDLFEKEYQEVNDAFLYLEDVVCVVEEFGEESKLSEVKQDVKRLWKIFAKLLKAHSKIEVAIRNLQAASEK